MDNTNLPGTNNSVPRLSTILYGVAWLACIAAILGLPWLFPPTTEVASDSYNVGFSNTVCTLCAWIAVALLAMLLTIGSRPPATGLARMLDGATHRRARSVPPWPPCAFAACYCLVQWLWYLMLPEVTFGDMYDYVNKLDLVLMHRVPGRDFYWSYGPLFLDLPAALVRLTGNWLDTATAYVLSLLLFTAIGLWMLWYVCDILASTSRRALLLYGAIALAGANLSMGSSYTMIRFVYPFAALLCLHRLASFEPVVEQKRRLWRLEVASAGLMVLGFAISPEIGIALGVTLLIDYACLWRVAPNVALPRALALGFAAVAVYLLVVPGSLDSIKTFGSGAWTFPVYPSFYTIAFLATLLGVVPPLLVQGFKVRDRDGALACGLATIVLVLVPAALGRCDPGHIFMYGLGAFLIGLAWVQHIPTPRFGWSLGGFALFYSLGLPLAFGIAYRPQMQAVFTAWRAGQRKPDRNWLRPPRDPEQARLDQKVARALARYGPIGTPFERDEQFDIFLKREGLYVPEYFIGESAVSIGTHAQLDRKLADMSRMQTLLFPLKLEHPFFDPPVYERHQAAYFSNMFFAPITYHLLHMPFLAEFQEAAYVRQNFVPVLKLGPSVLMVRRSAVKK